MTLTISQIFLKCQLCNFSTLKEFSDSTNRDLVISAFFGKTVNMVAFVRTLRSTGCKATIVLLIDHLALTDFSENHFRQLHSCGVILHDIGIFYENKRRYFPGFAMIPIIEYVFKMNQFYNRVLYCDSFDIVFQRDPFSSNLPPDRIQFATERSLYQDTLYNQKWYNELPFPKIFPTNSFVINSGQIYGESRLVSKYFDLFLNYYHFKQLTGLLVHDQAYMNFLVYNNHLTNISLKYDIDREYGIFSTTLYVASFHGAVIFGNIQDNSDTIQAAVIHQFDRNSTLRNLVLASCPQGAFPVSNFIRYYPQRK